MPQSTKHAEGALVGVLIGDSIGSLVEGDAPSSVAHRWATPSSVARVVPGQYSAVSEMTAALAASLASEPRFDGEDFAKKLLAGATPRRGYGEGTRRALDLLRAGGAWDEASATFPGRGCFGNGAAARAVPVGLVGDDLDWLRWLAEEQAAVTHAHALAAEGAVAVAVATAILIDAAGQDLDPARFLMRVASECRLRELRERITGAAELISKPFNASRVLTRLGNNSTTLGSVATGLYCFAACHEDFIGSVGNAFLMGGNATSIAAMAGGFSGAYLGMDEIPQNWLAGLESGPVNAAALVGYAGSVAGSAPE